MAQALSFHVLQPDEEQDLGSQQFCKVSPGAITGAGSPDQAGLEKPLWERPSMSHKETCTGLYKKSIESFKQKMMHAQMLKRTPFDV